MVEVIQFRNAFDAQGPSVPGIQPAEAVSRLQDFQMRFQIYDIKRKTLDSVSKLFGIACKPFPELDRTGEVFNPKKREIFTCNCIFTKFIIVLKLLKIPE